ncbi:MAG: hypothetical protein HYZ69_01515 [Candidatus Colwellbacteria bacterium]|nr:hypothetical protein [Candidatus Colwellbacteria bacterium]
MPENMEGVTIACGGNYETFEYAGKTVGDARRQLADILHIPPAATAVVNGRRETDQYVLQRGDHLDFQKEAGSKAILGSAASK